MIQGGDQLRRGRVAQSRLRGHLEIRRREPIDAPLVATVGQVQMRDDVVGDVDGLDHFARHVEHEQRAIRRVDTVNRPEPDVSRADEFSVRVGPLGAKRGALGNQFAAMDQIILRAAHEQVAHILAGVGVSAIDGQARGGIDDVVAQAGRRGRSLSGRQTPAGTNLAPLFDRTRAKNRRHARRHAVNRGGHGQIGIAGQIVLRQHDVKARLRFAAQEAIEPIVKSVAELF